MCRLLMAWVVFLFWSNARATAPDYELVEVAGLEQVVGSAPAESVWDAPGTPVSLPLEGGLQPGQAMWLRARLAVPVHETVGLAFEAPGDAVVVRVDGEEILRRGDPSKGVAGGRGPLFVELPWETLGDGEVDLVVEVWGGHEGAPLGPVRVGLAQTTERATEAWIHQRWRSPEGAPTLLAGAFLVGTALAMLGALARRREEVVALFSTGPLLLGGRLAWGALVFMGLAAPGAAFVHTRWPMIGLALLGMGLGMARLAGWGSSRGNQLRMTHVMVGLGLGLLVGVPRVGTFDGALAGALTGAALVTVGLAERFTHKIRVLDRTLDASTRFVPEALLGLLGRTRITEVERGDSTQLEMVVLFCDIRGFTTLSEGRTPAENFRFINAFLAVMEPCVRAYGGFLATNLGDGFMALFPIGRSDAVGAAVAMQRALVGFNADQEALGQAAVGMGIGLHAGPVMLGTLGGAERLDTGVVSAAADLASQVESLSKTYGAPLLVSGAVVAISPGVETLEVDRIDGPEGLVSLFEVLDGETDTVLRERKQATAAAFDVALKAWRSGELQLARERFVDLEPLTRAKLFVERCDWLLANGLPDPWNGVMRVGVR